MRACGVLLVWNRLKSIFLTDADPVFSAIALPGCGTAFRMRCRMDDLRTATFHSLFPGSRPAVPRYLVSFSLHKLIIDFFGSS